MIEINFFTLFFGRINSNYYKENHQIKKATQEKAMIAKLQAKPFKSIWISRDGNQFPLEILPKSVPKNLRLGSIEELPPIKEKDSLESEKRGFIFEENIRAIYRLFPEFKEQPRAFVKNSKESSKIDNKQSLKWEIIRDLDGHFHLTDNIVRIREDPVSTFDFLLCFSTKSQFNFYKNTIFECKMGFALDYNDSKENKLKKVEMAI